MSTHLTQPSLDEIEKILAITFLQVLMAVDIMNTVNSEYCNYRYFKRALLHSQLDRR